MANEDFENLIPNEPGLPYEVGRITHQELLFAIREIRETKNLEECVEMLQSQKWVAINAVFQSDGVLWALARHDKLD